ncbi:Uncharacterized protein Fot_36317 [Forsythia ovata]|uniref:Uncharacterized protein n=1 Tax=Forsythia ovata TaxID=205694 RepID=A0ABD1SQL6_9LAMI
MVRLPELSAGGEIVRVAIDFNGYQPSTFYSTALSLDSSLVPSPISFHLRLGVVVGFIFDLQLEAKNKSNASRTEWLTDWCTDFLAGQIFKANKSKSSRQTNVHEHVDLIPSVQAAQHSTRPPLSNAQQLLGTHYQHWEAHGGLNLLPTYGMDVPTMQIYAPMLQPAQDAVFGARDESVRSNLSSKN